MAGQVELRKRLEQMAEEDYRIFTSKLLPGTEGVLGVRLPALRKLARELAAGDWRGFLAVAADDSFEEIMLQGLVIGYARGTWDEMRPYVERFVPKISNWSVCDSFCNTLKIAERYPQEVWEFLKPYLRSMEEYQVRFAVVMLLNHYLDQDHIPSVLELLDGVCQGGYYARMAVAWALSLCFIRDRTVTEDYLPRSRLDDWTFNKALQKIGESYQVDKSVKARVRGLRRGKAPAAPLSLQGR